MYRWRFLILLLWINNRFVSVSVNAKKPSEDNNDNNIQEKYLYHTEEARGIIIDYEPPSTSGDAKDDPNLYRPDFIYGPNQGPRVVEFYAPWCPHVRICVVAIVLA